MAESKLPGVVLGGLIGALGASAFWTWAIRNYNFLAREAMTYLAAADAITEAEIAVIESMEEDWWWEE